jgi:hypothetical protein
VGVTIESGAGPARGDAVALDPRRLVLADLVTRLAVGVSRQAKVYEVAAKQAGGDLGQALANLARGKRRQATDLGALSQAIGSGPPPAPPPSPPAMPFSAGAALGEAFQAERALQGMARELAALATDPDVKALALRLAGAAGRDGEAVRKLYLRYS